MKISASSREKASATPMSHHPKLQNCAWVIDPLFTAKTVNENIEFPTKCAHNATSLSAIRENKITEITVNLRNLSGPLPKKTSLSTCPNHSATSSERRKASCSRPSTQFQLLEELFEDFKSKMEIRPAQSVSLQKHRAFIQSSRVRLFSPQLVLRLLFFAWKSLRSELTAL